MLEYFIYYLLGINLLTFIVWGVDKQKAIKNKWRINEKILFILVLIGGFLGGVFGMQIFRHKTIKSKFLYYFWAIVFIWLILLFVILYNI